MNKDIYYNKILKPIDKILCDPKYDYNNKCPNKLRRIHFKNESTVWASKIIQEEGGKHWRASSESDFYIIIHRFSLDVPNYSYYDEACTLLHECGHNVSFKNGDGGNISETGYDYSKKDELQKYKVLLEEFMAWKYALFYLFKLQISIRYKILLFLHMIIVSFPISYYSYIDPFLFR